MADNQEKETPKATPVPKEDKIDKLVDAIAALTTHLAVAKKEETKPIPAKVEPVYEAVRFYDEHDATRPYQREKLKTVGEITREAQESLIQERHEFLSDCMATDLRKMAHTFGRNKVHYDEYAFIRIYESSSPTFQEMYKDQYEKLMNCDYRGLLNEYIITQKQMDRFLKNDEEKYHRHNSQSITLNSLARELIFRRGLLA